MLDIDEDAEELQVNYMVESKEGLFLWPGKKDVSWEDMDKLICKITSPEIDEHASSNRLVYYQFKENEVKRAKEKLALL